MTEKTLAAALALAQAEMKNPARNETNGHFKTRYADLASCRNAVIPTLAKHGIGCVQIPGVDDGRVTLSTVLIYGSERLACGTLALPMSGGRGNPAHVMGSALTYMRRYALCAVAGVSGDDDDDGNNLGGKPQPKPQDAPLRHSIFDDLAAALKERFGSSDTPEGFGGAEALAREVLFKGIGQVFDGGDQADARKLLDVLEGGR